MRRKTIWSLDEAERALLAGQRASGRFDRDNLSPRILCQDDPGRRCRAGTIREFDCNRIPSLMTPEHRRDVVGGYDARAVQLSDDVIDVEPGFVRRSIRKR